MSVACAGQPTPRPSASLGLGICKWCWLVVSSPSLVCSREEEWKRGVHRALRCGEDRTRELLDGASLKETVGGRTYHVEVDLSGWKVS